MRAAQVPPPGNLGPSGQALWNSILAAGCIGEHDIPLLLEAFEWYTTYRDALGQLQQDVTNSRARMTSNTAYQNFVATLKQIGVTPAILKKGKPVAPVSPMEQHCRKLESQGLGDLADEMRHCGYDIMAWLRWQRGLGDDRGEEIPGEQALANEYQN